MKIESIRVCNFKGIGEDVKINTKGNSLIVSGKNSQGKSSFIDSIWSLLDSGNIPYKPIHDGESKAVSEISLRKENGDILRASRTYTSSGNTLKIEIGSDGFEVSKPASYLKKIIGKNINFDPVKFAELSKTKKGRKEQSELVQEILGINLSEWDNRGAKIKELRLESFRKKKDLEAKIKVSAEDMPVDQDKYQDPISLNELLEEKTKHKNTLDLISQAKSKKEKFEFTISAKKEQLERKQKEMEAMQKSIELTKSEIAKDEETISKCDSYIQSNSDVVKEVEAIDLKLSNLETHNSNYKKIKNHNDLVIALDAETLNHKNLDANFKDVGAQKLAAIEAKCNELSLGKKIYITEEGMLFIDGLPIEQLNTAQQIEVGLLLYMNTNPTLKIIRLEVSTLDDETTETIKALIKKYDYQAFLEKVENIDNNLHLNIIEED